MSLTRILFIVFSFTFSACLSKPVFESQRAPSSEVRNYPPDSFENGFVILDVLERTQFGKNKFIEPLIYPEDLAKVQELGLKPFRPLYRFNEPKKKKDDIEPWIGKNLDVTKRADAEELAKILQAYVYEGWFNDDKTLNKSDYENQFRANPDRTWCQTPWLNLTEKGREAIHGLTKEFPISSTSVYTVPEDIEKDESAVTWGVAFFNRKVCNEYDRFYHPKKADPSLKDDEAGLAKMIAERKPVFNAANGAVTFKLLFNAMQDWPSVMGEQWGGAYNWYAHVSHARQDDKAKNGDESIRHIMNVAHVQMDIGFKDARVKGLKPELRHWAMTTYYYDKNYVNEYLKDMAIPEPLKKMRPVGLQYGLNAGESHIFDGARNNHRPQGVELPFEATRLNGPVDNKVSSCLGCHAISGINFGLPPTADGRRQFAAPLGFLDYEDVQRLNAKGEMRTVEGYKTLLDRAQGGNFDFDMQVDKSIRNFQNSKGEKIFPEIQK